MFSFLYSAEKKMRQEASNWLELADRIYKFRRDQLNDAQTKRLVTATGDLKSRVKEKGEPGRIKQAIEALEKVLRETGGRIYPVSSIRENVEFLLVAAIVILGLRAYFVQPFKIPTNSMWPSYYGMTQEVFPSGEVPGALSKVVRLVTLGASNYSMTAPADGEVMIPIFQTSQPAYTERSGRSMLVFPAVIRDYTFSVGGELVRMSVPAEWAQSNFDDTVREAFFKDEANVYLALNEAAKKTPALRQSTIAARRGVQGAEETVYWVATGKKVRRGEKILSFDILTGDMLFVDRLTNNFIQPKIGQGFVFRTDNIRSPYMMRQGEQLNQYYIKRLVGIPGDKLEVKPPELWRNGRPIEGAAAFGKNARKEGLYPGYTNTPPTAPPGYTPGLMPAETQLVVPEHVFFAMGDNSPKSEDSRYWGFVPEKDVVGRPLFIYYPLTRRWGPAR